jgi:hypothetical protein
MVLRRTRGEERSYNGGNNRNGSIYPEDCGDRSWMVTTFYPTEIEHSPRNATGIGGERTPWHATQRAAQMPPLALWAARPCPPYPGCGTRSQAPSADGGLVAGLCGGLLALSPAVFTSHNDAGRCLL